MDKRTARSPQARPSEERGQQALASHPAGSSFGQLVRSWRWRAGLTQEELADRSGLSVRAIRDLESGRIAQPRPGSQRLLAGALGLDDQEFRDLTAASRPATLEPGGHPAQLPTDVADFTGRTEHIEELCDLLGRDPTGPDASAAVVVSAIAGKAGVGKTALAVHVAHALRGSFPDGQLYVNLRGANEQAAEPGDVLGRFLRALGVDAAALPDDIEERRILYRCRLAGQRVLVLLDNAARESQVRPLVPGGPGCAVLITSRVRLVGLEGAALTDLDVLDPDQAVELLGRLAGPERVAAEPEAADELARQCGHLPLAVRICGAKLRVRPHRSLAWLSRRLGDESQRLNELTVGDLEVRASLALSYQDLDRRERQAFTRLGLLEAPDFPAWPAGALLDASPDQAEELADTLVDAQLLEVAGKDATGHLRYRFHDLLRLYAREQAGAEEAVADRAVALERALGAWLALAEEADMRLASTFFTVTHGSAVRWRLPPEVTEGLLADPLAWFESERGALVAAVEQSAAWGLPENAWDLAVSLAGFFEVRGHFDEWRHTFDVALAATRTAGNRRGEAAVLRGLGELHTFQDRYDAALSCFEQARVIFSELGDHSGEAVTASGCGLVYRVRGRHADALSSFRRAVTISQQFGFAPSEAYALLGMGTVFLQQGDYEDARACFEQALTICRQTGYRDGEAQNLWRLGMLEMLQGRIDQARARLREARDIWTDFGNRLGEAHVDQSLGQLHLHEGRSQEAEALLGRCLEVYQELGDRYGEALTLRCLGEAHLAQRRLGPATERLGQALHIWRELQVPIGRAQTLTSLGDVHLAGGNRDAAHAAWGEALNLFRELKVPQEREVAVRLERKA
jgi:tetratricopeptide (TPR) repeat protein/transcriptional regulator with XRE-family HTH domain